MKAGTEPPRRYSNATLGGSFVTPRALSRVQVFGGFGSDPRAQIGGAFSARCRRKTKLGFASRRRTFASYGSPVDQDNDRTAQAHRPAPSRCVHLRRCAFPVARRLTTRKSRDCSPARPADSGASSCLRTIPFRSATKRQVARCTPDPPALRGTRDSDESHGLATQKRQSRPVSGCFVLRSDLAFGTVSLLRCSSLRVWAGCLASPT